MSAPYRPAHNLFLAAIPDPALIAQMEQAWHLAGTGEKFRAQTLHLTVLDLFQLADVEAGLVDRLTKALDGAAFRGFDLVFDRLMTFGGQAGGKALVLGMQGGDAAVSTLAVQLYAALGASGLPLKKPRKVTPHVTLAYGAGFAEARLLDAPLVWPIRGITLVDSLQGAGRHVHLGHWPLSAR